MNFIPHDLRQTVQQITVHQTHHPGIEIIQPLPFEAPFAPPSPLPPIIPIPGPLAMSLPPPPLIVPPMFPPPISVPLVAPDPAPVPLPIPIAPGFSSPPAHQRLTVVYIVSYSPQRLAAGDALAHTQYQSAISASGISAPLFTFDASHFPYPPVHLCAMYSGVSRQIQDYIKTSDQALRDIDEAVRLVMQSLDLSGSFGSRLLLVTCPDGTYRSVAAAEMIRRKLNRRGVTTVHLTHAHRMRLPGDVI